jgi:hypothetical protein
VSAVIRDFSFAPSSITVTAGQTVTWTNDGPTDHTATAADGSFDTGILHRGRSRTLTFKHTGTFAYVCSLHPNMHGTLNVKAAATTPSSSGPAASPSGAGPGSPSAGPRPSTPASSGRSASGSPTTSGHLPYTGTEPGIFLGVGLLLLCAARLAFAAGRRGAVRRGLG